MNFHDLKQFQKLIVQDLYIKKLNQWLDELQWENEKKDALAEMLEKEIEELKNQAKNQQHGFNKLQNDFRLYMSKVKTAKVDIEKQDKQQAIISDLRQQLTSTQKRLEISHRMNTLLTKQRG